MLPDSDLDDIVRAMWAAQEQGSQLAPLSARLAGFDTPSAYAVAARLHARRLERGAIPVGRKIGFTNPEMWARYGVTEPIWAHVYASTVIHVRGGHAECAISRFCEPRIEPEIVLHFHTAPPADAGLDALLRCIDWVAHGFEVVQSHHPDWKFQLPDTIVDGALHGALFVGAPQPLHELGPDPAEALRSFSIDLTCDGMRQERGLGSNVLGSPLAAALHLVAVLARQSPALPLQAGELVTTGTLTAARSVRAGETWATTLGGINLPGLSIHFTA